MGTICWVGIHTSCSDLLCWSALQQLLQLRQMLDIMAVATVDMDMVAIVAMEDMDMAMVILEKDQLMLNLKLRLATAMEDMDMAVGSMVVVVLAKDQLMPSLKLRQMLDIMAVAMDWNGLEWIGSQTPC